MHSFVVIAADQELHAFISEARTEQVRYFSLDPTGESSADRIDGYERLNGSSDRDSDVDAIVIVDPAASGILEAGLEVVRQSGAEGVPVLAALPFATATAIASELDDANPVATFSWVPGATDLGGSIEFATALQSDREDVGRLQELLATICGGTLTEVEDRVGHVSMRVLSMIINEAVFALQEGVADVGDIDTAMKLGTNYPEGPLAWCDRIGADAVVATLDGLQLEYGEERYRPAVLLRQYARAGRHFAEATPR